MNQRILDGRVAIITGASRSIGKSMATAMAQAGADVVVTYLGDEEAEAAVQVASEVEAAGAKSLAIPVDISQPSQVEALITQAVDTFGQLDILVNNAATFHRKIPLVDLPVSEWKRIIDVNLTGTFLCAQRAARQMIEQRSGVIINISSSGAEEIFSNMGAYAASKGGINTLTRSLAVELAPFGIRVNGIAPGHIDTVANTEFLAEVPGRDERFYRRIPAGRLGYKEELANLAVFLASDAVGYLTGQTIPVEGGLTIWQGPVDE
ncbi:MAG: SDR family oxidoreductase [Chloroflexota bacterium]